jgi:lipopolysaccharide export LptBFGC system permease protein LptF
MRVLRDLTGDDRRALVRVVGASAAIMIVGTLVLVLIPLLKLVSLSQPDSAYMALYLVPQALPLSMPVGLMFGILWGFTTIAASRRSRILVVLVATTASVASFTMLGWVVPTANQAFRVSLFYLTAPSGHVLRTPPAKGANELTLGELRQLIEPGTHERKPFALPTDVHSLAASYHGRWALAGAPLVLALFAVALSSRRPRRRIMPLLGGCLGIAGYCVVMQAAKGVGRDLTLPVFAVAWIPNVAFLILSIAIMTVSSQRERRAASA